MAGSQRCNWPGVKCVRRRESKFRLEPLVGAQCPQTLPNPIRGRLLNALSPQFDLFPLLFLNKQVTAPFRLHIIMKMVTEMIVGMVPMIRRARRFWRFS